MSSSSLARWIPSLTWLRVYDRSWLRGDVLAGITLAAYLLPAALGDASLANLRPEAGLYACLFGGLLFWIFCGSRHTVASVTSAISLVTALSDLMSFLRQPAAIFDWTLLWGARKPRFSEISAFKSLRKK